MNNRSAAAEMALKLCLLAADPELMAEIPNGDRIMEDLAALVDLTEAPEDAVCSLVIDLMRYCERETIDWTQEVINRARKRC